VMQCEWEDCGKDMDGTWMTWACTRPATRTFTDDGNTTWNFCDAHAAEAETENTNLEEVTHGLAIRLNT